MTIQYIYFVLFICFGYLIVTDSSVAKLVILISQLIKFQFQKYFWIIKHHPKTPWARYFIWRQSIRIAKELEKEFRSDKE